MIRASLRYRGPRPLLPSPRLRLITSLVPQRRSISILSGVTKLAGRTITRSLIGVGIGFGGLTWADMKVDGFKNSAISSLDQISTSLGSAYESFADSTSSTILSLSSTAAAFKESTAESIAKAGISFEEWFQNFTATTAGGKGEESGQEESYKAHSSSSDESPNHNHLLLPALALPFALDHTGDDDLLDLTKKLIEIRSMLLSLHNSDETSPANDELKLPSIVVIGSQSSGKSSVLESIVGKEFLPKGDNMVTRRPIELTLIHTPPTPQNPFPETYATFPSTTSPSTPSDRITDFTLVQSKLLSLNLSVPASECISSSPITLHIYSPTIPDLTLIDLPGYVQLSSLDQPPELKTKIRELCNQYIQAPNLILAICAADVDLANSPALRAAREVDPMGLRTLGVVTKCDLVAREVGKEVLKGERYPLGLGYVGVVSKKSGKEGKEEEFFKEWTEEKDQVGTEVLKKKLMRVLEESMRSSLWGITQKVNLELEEVRYKFKVEYNDRSISSSSYLREVLDLIKERIREIHENGFEKKKVRQVVKDSLDQVCLDLLAGVYWTDREGRLKELSSPTFKPSPTSPEDEELVLWERKLESVTSNLTKSGIGRQTTSLLLSLLRRNLSTLSSSPPLSYHPSTISSILALSDSILLSRSSITSSQVENSIKPLKFEIELTREEWEKGRKEAAGLMKRELGMCEEALKECRRVGGKGLGGAVEWLRREEEGKRVEGDEVGERFGKGLLDKAREAMFLTNRSEILKMRLLALKSKRCKQGQENKVFCPEAFLNVVADKLAYTAVQFINIELLVEYFYQFPREIDSRLSSSSLSSDSQEAILKFARENPVIKAHLELQERKEKLEAVAEKLDTLVKLERDRTSKAIEGGYRVDGKDEEKKGRFSFF